MKTFTDEQLDQIAQRLRDGSTLADVARSIDASSQSDYRRLKKQLLRRFPEERKRLLSRTKKRVPSVKSL
jgi:transposase-like protein